MQVQTSGSRFNKDTTDRFFAQALEEIQHVSGVTNAAFTSQLPLSGDDDEFGARFEGDDASLGYAVFRYAVSPGYFEASGIPLRRGRPIDTRDSAGAPPVAVISDTLAKFKFPHQDPIGRRIHLGPEKAPWYTIVGVAGDVKQASLSASQSAAVYIATTQSWFVDNPISFVVRMQGDAAALVPPVRRAIWSVDKDQPIVRVATMDSLLAATEAQRRFALILLGAFGIAALVLVTSGIYGVLSGSVTERVREIGVRLALGAPPAKVLKLILRQGMMLTGFGVAIGLCGAALASRAVVTLLFGISHLDPITYVGVIALLAGVSLAACWMPAWRASRVDPAITLRAE
jgi:predicted permease